MSTPINDGGPAFPVADTIHTDGQVQFGFNGMTLRDYFAGQALAGMPWSYEISLKDQSKQCFQIADAMLAESKRKERAA
jgi:hypothetical protein